jgi:phenylpropionate dioxygenase-like ring-hydroxylating dioxygenase large terminal subunit
MINVESAVREHEGLIDPRLFTDEDVYRQEMDRIFRHTWLFVGHETSIPNPGDYIKNYMGEDEVIVNRDVNGQVRVFLNRCAHRGNKVCLFDRGSQKVFTCTYHGWSYDTTGKLTGQAYARQAYGESFNREPWGLEEVPRVSSYGGLIFASWDPAIRSLDDYLGDLKPYLDLLLVRDYLGGIEVIPGLGKYVMPTNWKLMAENFMGDETHVPITHVSYFKASMESGVNWWGLGNFEERTIQLLVNANGSHNGSNNGSHKGNAGVPHAFGSIGLWGDPRPDSPFQIQPIIDRGLAQSLGAEAVEWVEERHRRMQEYIESSGAPKLYGSANWTIFPNFSMLLGFGAFRASSLIQWHPRGPMSLDAWQWCAVDKQAPESVKRLAVIHQAADQGPAGMITIDDTENFERSTDVLLAGRLHQQERPFNYTMSATRTRSTQIFGPPESTSPPCRGQRCRYLPRRPSAPSTTSTAFS